jgi:hypothetical protein
MVRFFRKYHKWLGLFFSIFLVFYSLSGIVMNHRDLFAGLEVSRKLMPERYTYNNWNLGALRGSEAIGEDSILMYGNMGIWLADGHLENLKDYSQGLEVGMDNHKVYSVYLSKAGHLYMGTLRGAFIRDIQSNQWKKIAIESHDERFVDITEKDGHIIILGRSHIFISEDKPNELKFERVHLQNPAGYDDKIGLFKTMWFLHSGEIYGDWGKLLVDLLGLVFILLSIGGIIYFFIPRKIKKNYKDGKSIEKTKGFHKWNLRWHNRLGYYFIVFLLITTITGVFLRPPGLIAIASAKVSKIPFTTVDTPSAWFDKLRAIHYDSLRGEYLVLTDEWAYNVDKEFETIPKLFASQPPISIMGVNVFEQTSPGTYLVGSFAGLFLWKPEEHFIYDYQNQQEYAPIITFGPPIRNSSVTGIVRNKNKEVFYIDYDSGIHAILKKNTPPQMPELIGNSPISIWNYALEVHTGRFFSFIFGRLYILIVPIVGLGTIFILISGFVVWWKRYR